MTQPRVLLEHDGRTYTATVLAQYRLDGRWRALAGAGGRYTTAPGMTYQRALWADELRSVRQRVNTSTS
jgi:hypothetical protein